MNGFQPALADLDHVLAHAEGVLTELRKQRIFLTGGTGFFGKWLLAALAHANARLGLDLGITVLTREPETFVARHPNFATNAAFAWVRGDTRDFAMPKGHFGHVLHAATATLAGDSPQALFATIVDGTRRVADFARTAGAANLLFVSSGAVYGAQPAAITHVAEDYRGAPDCTLIDATYGEGKRAAETACAIAAREGGLAPKIARCFAFLGPGLPLDAHFAAGNFIRDALRGREIEVASDGTAVRSYLYPADLVIWLLTIMMRGVALRPYNVGSDRAISIGELAETIGRHARVLHRVQKAPGTAQPHRYVPDIARARSELGLEVRIDLDDAIARTLSWHRSLARPALIATGASPRGIAHTHF
jgi:dTDP-glucose 4,6-dehydratase